MRLRVGRPSPVLAALALALVAGCSVVVSLDDLDKGGPLGVAGQGGTSAGSGGSAGTGGGDGGKSSSAGSGGVHGGAAGKAGSGGAIVAGSAGAAGKSGDAGPCLGTTDCATGLVCAGLASDGTPICQKGQANATATGQPCTTSPDCATNLCSPKAGACTEYCGSDAQCDANEHCAAIAANHQCLLACTKNEDCPNMICANATAAPPVDTSEVWVCSDEFASGPGFGEIAPAPSSALHCQSNLFVNGSENGATVARCTKTCAGDQDCTAPYPYCSIGQVTVYPGVTIDFCSPNKSSN